MELHLSQFNQIFHILFMFHSTQFFRSFLQLHFYTDCSIQIHLQSFLPVSLANLYYHCLDFYLFKNHIFFIAHLTTPHRPEVPIFYFDCSEGSFPISNGVCVHNLSLYL